MSINSQDYPGARWWKFDFHTHTPASHDTPWHRLIGSEEELAPETWLLKYMEQEIDCVVISDHNSGEWIDLLKQTYATMAAQLPEGFRALVLFPGVEISVCGGFHLLAIFAPSASTADIDSLLGATGYQTTKGDSDGVTSQGPEKVLDAIAAAGAIAIPAHVNDSKGLLKTHIEETEINGSAIKKNRLLIDSTTVRQILSHKSICALETTDPNFISHESVKTLFAKFGLVRGTDCHSFQGNPKAHPGSQFTWIKTAELSLESLRLALHDGNGIGIHRSDTTPEDFCPNDTPEKWIEELSVHNAKHMAHGKAAVFQFSPWLNAVIGGRGSGKSTLVHFVRLAGKRQNDLTTDRVKKTFEDFARIGNGVEQNTTTTLVYRKGGDRYRLLWKQQDGGTTVENWEDTCGLWVPEDSQEVTSRFPLTIFSQDQIGALAENSQAILQRIDEAINKPDWQQRWDEELASYLKDLAEVGRLRGQLVEKDRLSGQLTDLNKKLEVFEKSEHADILKTARRFQKQQSEFVSLLEAHNDRISGLEDFTENFLLYDLPVDLIDDANINEDILTEVETNLRTSISKASEILGQVAADLRTANTEARCLLNESDWQKARKVATEKYTALVNDLKEKGVDNPNEFSTLIVDKQSIESKLKKLQNLTEIIDQHLAKAQNSADRMFDLRQELQDLRKDFLETNLANNTFVHISLVPYGSPDDLKSAEESLRGYLGCQDGRFASSIISEDGQYGILGGLYRELPRGSDEARKVEIEKRLTEWKNAVRAIAEGRNEELELSKPFASFLQRSFETNPESIFRLESWWPEDSLEVSYSKGGEGRNFTPLANGSAGEKAAALLAFFLAYGDAPLVIDQPENDLDNHLITDLVVKQLQNNKTRRQIIVVTHNPNIVVNGDAEMVHAMGFKNGQCQPIAQGALQNPKVRSEVCNVMEGGERALEKRYQRLIT